MRIVSMENCEHGRMCVKCPNEMLNEATKHLQFAASILEDVHRSFDGITVKKITTWFGDTKAELIKRD